MFKKFAIAAAGFSIAATTVLAGGHGGGPYDSAIAARQGQMALYNQSLGILGAMAKGDMEYDAGTAAGAAANLAAASKLNASTFWPQGSDSFENENTRALPAIWENFPDVGAKAGALVAAADAMAAVAGDGIDGVRGAIGGVGQACSACHKAYRKPPG